MKIIGALARGNSAPTIYFCEYCHSEIEKEAIQALLTNTQYKDDVYGDTIRGFLPWSVPKTAKAKKKQNRFF